MKPLFTFIMIILFANFSNAQTNYDALWKQVEAKEIEGLPKSALEIVVQIETKAKAENNASQTIKTLLYKSKFALILEEDAQLKVIKDFKVEISKNSSPTKNVLENMLANLYWQYFNQNRWKFYNRTNTAEKVDTEDFRTWDLQTLFDEVHLHFKNSLQNGLILQQTALKPFEVILHKQDGSETFRPSLFDLLAHNALQFYKTNETNITQPAYKFKINDVTYLGAAEPFAKLNITSKDETSLQLNALKIYQDLIQFHLKDKDPYALADVNIERLLFVQQFGTFSNKDSILLEALKTEHDSVASHEVSALYNYEIATIYLQQGATYQPKKNEIHRWKTKDALELCVSINQKFPESKGAIKAKNLKLQIEQQQLQIITEAYLPIQKDAKLLIRYKNLNDISFVIHKISESDYKKLNKTYREDAQLKLIQSLKDRVTFWQSSLKNEDDYQNHAMEVAIPKLGNGRYLIYAAPNNYTNTFAFQTIQVTDFALTEKVENKKHSFQVIDRNNGEPIINATVKLTYQKNYRDRNITKSLITNAQGEVHLEKTNERLSSLKVAISKNDQNAFFGEYYVNRGYNNPEETDRYQGFLFTDRSIYRPAQTIFFKGIAMMSKNGTSKVIANEAFQVELYDVNGTKVGDLELTSNDYGSVSGEFILPNGGLTGQYYLVLNSRNNSINTYQYISVEEYKRPKFEAKFNPVTDTFKVNDSITIKGNALAYAGSNITDAKVVYRVHRKVQYPRWYFWYRPWFNSEPQEITFGETQTNANGEFEVTFKAIPDDSVDKTSLPIFQYEVTADITDLNGETRSANTTINVGYHALVATVSVDAKLSKDQKDHELTIDTRNLNGEFVPAKGTIKIYKLQAPSQVLRKRPWQAPDYQTWTEAEFKTLFPHEAYAGEDDSKNWDKGILVLEKSFDTDKEKTIKLGTIKKWKSGEYHIELTSKDKYGQHVKDEARTSLYSKKDKTLADNQLFSATTNKNVYSTTDTVIFTLASAAQNITVTVDVEKDNKITNTYLVALNNNTKTLSIPVTKDDLGGFAIHYSYAAFNSSNTGIVPIAVPYPKSDLEIETTTFRDKLQPGVDETWRFKIKGPKGDKVSAELLASMYDASLDQFRAHDWYFTPIDAPNYYSQIRRNASRSFKTDNFRVYLPAQNYDHLQLQNYDQFNWFGFYIGNSNFAGRLRGKASGVLMKQSMVTDNAEMAAAPMAMEEEADLDEVVVTAEGSAGQLNSEESTPEPEQKETPDFSGVTIRKNLQETAFFFPQLQTNKEGDISFSFTTPEALTKWKLQLLAHTKTLESAVTRLETVTQKELMVIPNAPRFLREGDKITISTKIANLTENALSGLAKLELTDAITGQDITSDLVSSRTSDTVNDTLSDLSIQKFTVDAKGNTQVSWNLEIPMGMQAVQYKVIAKAGDFSDGEQNALPVLSNRMLVTETLPMWIRSNETKTFTLDKLANLKLVPEALEGTIDVDTSRTSVSTLKHHKLTLEMTSNPAWYAVQALPYLMEYPYECNEQTFSRYYANALASHIANSNPRIQEVFNQWRNTDALLSNLEKNQELKSLLIQETPWLRDAQSETEQKKRIALLFDLNKMNGELRSALRKLQHNQMPSGAWPWFNGGRANRYITQHIVTGFGHLDKLGVIKEGSEESQMLEKAVRYLDSEFVQEYKDLRKYNKDVDLTKDHLSYTQLHYLYMRSFNNDIKKSKQVEEITTYYKSQIQKYWLKRSLYAKGLMTLVMHRTGDANTSAKILNSLKENSITSEELGMYWKENTSSWFWYQAPIETQALMVEVFSEAGTVFQNKAKNLNDIDNLKIWLLKNKQTNRWKTTKETTEAVYALLLQGSDWLSVTDMVDVVIGGQEVSSNKLDNVKVEAGTGYYKTSWSSNEIQPKMANVKITKKGDGIAWGALYWQYFEDLDKITSAETPLKLKKKLFLKQNTDKGEQISEITPETPLKVGDLVRVRIELRSDRAMEFVHMKDMRAAGLEPVNVLSQYKWQDGLGYYESTKDASTNFFFDYLPKGVYVFEYDLRVNNAGDMSNGITTIQSMYAPEFSSHSEGVRISVDR